MQGDAGVGRLYTLSLEPRMMEYDGLVGVQKCGMDLCRFRCDQDAACVQVPVQQGLCLLHESDLQESTHSIALKVNMR